MIFALISSRQAGSPVLIGAANACRGGCTHTHTHHTLIQHHILCGGVSPSAHSHPLGAQSESSRRQAAAAAAALELSFVFWKSSWLVVGRLSAHIARAPGRPAGVCAASVTAGFARELHAERVCSVCAAARC
jgi:hypothetical protein